ncbi:MAG: hypothetical protein ABFD04_00100 [Syntrophomonas sp.]
MKKVVYSLLLCCFLTSCLVGCSEKQSTTSPSSSSNTSTTQKTDAVTATPKIEQATAYRKADTTLKESDIVNVSVRNVEYDEKTKAFKKDLTVYVDGQKKSFHDVKPIGNQYYQLTIDLPPNASGGSVSVKYGDSTSNTVNFTFK